VAINGPFSGGGEGEDTNKNEMKNKIDSMKNKLKTIDRNETKDITE